MLAEENIVCKCGTQGQSQTEEASYLTLRIKKKKMQSVYCILKLVDFIKNPIIQTPNDLALQGLVPLETAVVRGERNTCGAQPVSPFLPSFLLLALEVEAWEVG